MFTNSFKIIQQQALIIIIIMVLTQTRQTGQVTVIYMSLERVVCVRDQSIPVFCFCKSGDMPFLRLRNFSDMHYYYKKAGCFEPERYQHLRQ